MCDHAFAWAKANGVWQINPVHKEEEASLVVERLFQVTEEGERIDQHVAFDTKDLNAKQNSFHFRLHGCFKMW